MSPRNPSAGAVITLFVVLALIAWSWRSCWYATPLSTEEIQSRLESPKSPNEVQKALVQVKDRLEEKGADTERFLPAVMALTANPTPQIRSTVAWVLGAAPDTEEVTASLKALLDDEDLSVRYNAACSLAAHGNDAGHDVLITMLAPTTVRSPTEGVFRNPRATEKWVRRGQILGRVETPKGEIDVVAPLDGRLIRRVHAHGDVVKEGEPLVEIDPSPGQIENALYALGRVGTREDMSAVREIAEGARNITAGTRAVARRVLQALGSR